MNGPQHYGIAEALLNEAHNAMDIRSPKFAGTEGLKEFHRLVASAQVHATLALAAATARSALVDYYGDENDQSRAWSLAIA